MPCCQPVPKNAAAASRAASAAATRAATAAARKAAVACPPGGCRGARGKIVQPKTVQPRKGQPCNCGQIMGGGKGFGG